MRLPRWLNFRRASTRRLWALALLFTLLNSIKPLLIDDSAYYYFAKQITRDPLRPYDFFILWYDRPLPANMVLAPPVLPYWWAIGLALFGENAFLWKLWLFPFSLLFVGALGALLCRFAKGMVAPVLWMTVLSPTFLPSLNLMLDVPALALSLAAIAVFFRAFQRGSMVRAAFAGLLAGLAMETKYTGFLAPAVVLLYSVVFWGRPFAVNFRRRVVPGLLTVLLAAGLFLSWEAMIAHFHGESHFLCNLRQNDDTLRTKVNLIVPLLLILGALSPPIVLLSLAALRTPRLIVVLVGALMALGYGLIAALPHSPRSTVAVEDLVFAGFGILTLATAAAVMGQLWFNRALQEIDDAASDVVVVTLSLNRAVVFAAMDGFLALWLGGEFLGCLALTPFPAARRIMGVIVVGTLLAARLAARTCQTPPRRLLLRSISSAGVALGLLYYGVDLHDALADQEAAERAAAAVRALGPDGPVWYVGHWGFQYYAERAGMKPVIPEQSHLQEGDWLVVPDRGIIQQQILVDRYCMELAARFHVEDSLPVRTVPGFYGGRAPLERHSGPRVEVAIYRVIRPFVPRADED